MGVGDLVSEMALETQIPPVIFWMLDAQGWTHTIIDLHIVLLDCIVMVYIDIMYIYVYITYPT